ncbi:MAG TPA: SPOR domain-containing protein [Gemmatimonadales bacterium]|nr:SPOR domain-containing protein [Gemmatimonadales bacterium]
MHRIASWPALAGAALLVLASAPLAAQTDSQLVRVVQMAQEGQGDSARSLMNRILATTSPGDSLYPEVLYTSGLVARTVPEMRRAYQRVSVEYGASAWADDALLRLGLLDFADGNPAGTLKNVERIRSDYPASPLMAVAAYWGARASFDLKRPAEACHWVDEGEAGVGDNVELKNQLDYLQNRCGPGMVAAPDTTKVDSSKVPPPLPPPAAKGGYSVQIGAVKTEAAANDLLKALTGAGYPGHIVKEGGYFKVRAGPYPTRTAADQAAAKIKAARGGAPYVLQDK